ncbi:MAG: hypothetical protein EOO82_03615, partial [Oxalobacteraceae bacterium]
MDIVASLKVAPPSGATLLLTHSSAMSYQNLVIERNDQLPVQLSSRHEQVIINKEFSMPFIQSSISRRLFCGAVGGSVATAVAMPSLAVGKGTAVNALGRSGINMSREEQLRFLIRFMASLKEEDCTWYYYGRLLAQVGDAAPKALVIGA